MPQLEEIDLRPSLEVHRKPGHSWAGEAIGKDIAAGNLGLAVAGIGASILDSAAGRGRGARPESRSARPAAPAIVSRPEITGSKDLGTIIPATVGGRTVSQWKPDDFSRYGEHFGVDGMGNASKPVVMKDSDGRTVHIPSSFLADGPAPSYYDQLALKAQGINPNKLPIDIRDRIHDRMVKATSPGESPSDEHNFNSLLFGMTSPNNPLTPNMIALARTLVKSPDDIQKLADMTPWTLDQASSVKGGKGSLRQEISRDMANRIGVQAASRGGLGVVGSADWTRMSDAAKMFLESPDFFRYERSQGNLPKHWEEHVNRVASQIPGLSFKTGSFGSVWQNPGEANISAMDRHMAGRFRGQLHADPEKQAAWEKAVVASFNRKRAKSGANAEANSIDEMIEMPGGIGHYADKALGVLNQHKDAKFRLKKTGEINPEIAEHYKQTPWIREPDKVTKMSPAYSGALAENARLANEGGRGIFSEQWRIWDNIRKRLEPHEIMNPGLSKVGRMSKEQLDEARIAHRNAGYMKSPSEVRRVDNPSSLALFSAMPGLIAVPGLAAMLLDQADADERERSSR
jgi:hypothetical protein